MSSNNKYSTITNNSTCPPNPCKGYEGSVKLNPYYVTGILIPEKLIKLESVGFVDGKEKKTIVVWGTNITSLVGRGKLQIKKIRW